VSLFVAEGLVKRFGGLTATDNVSFTVAPHEVHALIGPNGAGKSTIVNLLSGLLAADAGRLTLNDIDITGLSPHARVRAGLSRCFQVTSIFRSMTVRENLLLAVQSHVGSSFRFIRQRDDEQDLQAAAAALAARVGLQDMLDSVAGSLPHGNQRKLDVALALASNPKVLLLDEPLAGMGPEESLGMIELIGRLRRETAILLIEHDMEAVFQLADRISVLVYGRVLTSGSVSEIRNNPEVQAVYLGTEEAA